MSSCPASEHGQGAQPTTVQQCGCTWTCTHRTRPCAYCICSVNPKYSTTCTSITVHCVCMCILVHMVYVLVCIHTLQGSLPLVDFPVAHHLNSYHWPAWHMPVYMAACCMLASCTRVHWHRLLSGIACIDTWDASSYVHCTAAWSPASRVYAGVRRNMNNTKGSNCEISAWAANSDTNGTWKIE